MPDIKNKEQYHKYQQAVADFIMHNKLSFVSTGAPIRPDEGEYMEPWFSWQPCECCGSTLGGMRDNLFARDAENIIVHFEICEDCVYYVNYGRLDDTTMMDMEDTCESR